MMALYHKKFLFAEPGKKPELDQKVSSDCFMCYVCPQDCYISPIPPLPPPPQQLSQPDQEKSHVSTLLILMLCSLAVAFLVLSYLTIARYRSRRRNPESLGNSSADFLDENQAPVLDHPIWYIRTAGLPQSVIDSISSFRYKKGERLIEGNDCPVCLNDFQENERLRLLPKCSHAFHVGCIDTWLRSHKNCPVCRAFVLIGPTLNPGVSSDESSSSSSGSVQVQHGLNELENRQEMETRESRERRDQEDKMAKISSKIGLVFIGRNKRFRVLSDLADHRVRVDDREPQRMRRSVSVDSASASMIYQAMAEKKGVFEEEQNSVKRDCKNSGMGRLMKSYSYSQSLQKRPVSMKRSLSFSGKRSVRKNSRSQESIQIPGFCMQRFR